MAVQVSDAAHAAALAQGAPEDAFLPFGERTVRGKGAMRTHLLRVGNWEEALAAQEAAAAEAAEAAALLAPMRRSSSYGVLPRQSHSAGSAGRVPRASMSFRAPA